MNKKIKLIFTMFLFALVLFLSNKVYAKNSLTIKEINGNAYKGELMLKCNH